MAESLGLLLTQPVPALTGCKVRGKWGRELNVRILACRQRGGKKHWFGAHTTDPHRVKPDLPELRSCLLGLEVFQDIPDPSTADSKGT